MASFNEGFELCKIPHGTEVLGVERHCDEDCVILTLGNKEVLVYNIADRKIVQSWSVEPKQKLTCPAVQDFSSKKYFMVKNEKELLSWDDSLSDLRDATIIQLPKAAQKIYSSVTLCHEPLVLFQDNTVVLVSHVEKGKEMKSEHLHQSLLWCGTHMSGDGVMWFSKILTSQDSMSVQLVMQPIEETSEAKFVFNIRSPQPNTKPCCWSLLNEKEKPVYVSIWSNSCLYKTEVPVINDREARKESVLHCEAVNKLNDDPQSSLDVSSFFLSNLISTFVCVATTSTSTNGVSKQIKDAITLWDVRFGTVQSRKMLSDIVKDSVPTPTGINNVLCTASFIVVANSANVLACSYRVGKSTLRNSLGTLRSVHSQQSLKPMFLSTPRLIKPNQEVENWTQSAFEQDEDEDQLLRIILDPGQTKTSKQLITELCKLSKVTEKNKGLDTDEINAKSNRKQRRDSCKLSVTSQYLVTCVFQLCVQERKFWSHDVGKFLIQSNNLPQRYLAQLIDIILESNDMVLVRESFQKLNGIPESSVVDSLKHILRLDNSAFESNTDEEWTNTKSLCCLYKARDICLLLGYPVNEVFLQECLRRLSFDETITLVQFLLHLIRNWKFSFQDLLNPADATHKLQYTHILDWAGLVLNAHFTQLIIFPEAQKLLVNLHEAVAEQITSYESLQELEGYLSHFKNKQLLPRQDNLGAYTVETMDL